MAAKIKKRSRPRPRAAPFKPKSNAPAYPFEDQPVYRPRSHGVEVAFYACLAVLIAVGAAAYYGPALMIRCGM